MNMIAFENVSFSYENGCPVVENLSFSIGKGETFLAARLIPIASVLGSFFVG